MSMIDLEPIVSKARDWRVGQCVGKITEAYAVLIYVNKRRCQLLSRPDDKFTESNALDNATRCLADAIVDVMYACRTLLWKLGLNDTDVNEAINRGKARNGFYDY